MKYRAWDKVNNEWITDCDLYMLPDGSVYAGDVGNPPLIEIKYECVSLSTGLKDKNGIEIYEGDIIRSDKESPIGTVVTAKVYWKGAGFALLTTRGSDTTSAYLELLSPFCEVIGNVHEHPHLLKGE